MTAAKDESATGFEDLLLEAWELCTDDEAVRASDEYKCARQWLSKLTMNGKRGEPEMKQLQQVVCTLRTAAADKCGGGKSGGGAVACGKSGGGASSCGKSGGGAAACGKSGGGAAACGKSGGSAAACGASDKCGGSTACGAADICGRGCGATDGDAVDCEANDPCAMKDLVKLKPPPPLNEKLCCALAAAQCACPMDMRRFFRDVAAYTCDGGALLMRVTSDVLSDFRAFVDTVFGNRVSQIGMVLAREQMTLRDRYAELECRTMNRAQLALMHVRDVMPTFDWNRYATDAGYIRSLVVSRCMEDANDDDVDGENARAKGLLYQLNWLRSEIDRADCENHGLHSQLTALTAELASINGKILANQCRSEAEKSRLSCELTKLRSKSSGQVCNVDKLMETIQIGKQNSAGNTKSTSAAANQ